MTRILPNPREEALGSRLRKGWDRLVSTLVLYRARRRKRREQRALRDRMARLASRLREEGPDAATPLSQGPQDSPSQEAGDAPEPPATTEAEPADLPLVLLRKGAGWRLPDKAELQEVGEQIVQAARSAGRPGQIEGILPGPQVSVFELRPDEPTDGGEALAALQEQMPRFRLEQKFVRSPVKVEVPNPERPTIRLRELLDTRTFLRSPAGLTLAVGVNLQSQPSYADLRSLPHLLVGGRPGSGVRTALRSLVTSLLFHTGRIPPQLLLLDLGEEVFEPFARLPHLRAQRITEPALALRALAWAVAEMERRYRRLAEVHVRSVDHYNQAVWEIGTDLSVEPLPYGVVVISDVTPLMEHDASDAETSLARLAQMARAVGLHLIVGARQLSPAVLTETLRANLPARLALTVEDRGESELLLGEPGAEQLLGAGDLLFLSPASPRPVRLYGSVVTSSEMAKVAEWFRGRVAPQLDPEVLLPRPRPEEPPRQGRSDPLYAEAVALVAKEKKVSASFLQRRLRLGFGRAALLIDQMEQDGFVGPPQGSRPREVFLGADEAETEPGAGRTWRVEKDSREVIEERRTEREALRSRMARRRRSPPAGEASRTEAWDFFISHASEDKEGFVRPLALALRDRGLKIWYDEFTLTVGDRLRRSIDAGLAGSRYGIVVISPSFLAKEWPQKELDALVGRETGDRKIVLPVWHNVDAEDVRAYSPILADRVALSSTLGMPQIVEALLAAVSLARKE